MKKKIIFVALIIFLLFIVIIFVNAESPIKPKKEATKIEQDTNNNHRGSDKSPLVVKIIPPIKDDKEAENTAKEKKEKAANDTRLIIITGLLAAIGFFQLIVFAWQGYWLRQSVKATQQTDRASIIIQTIVFNLTDIDPKRFSGGAIVLCNVGKTHGILLDLKATIEARIDVPKEFPKVAYGNLEEVISGTHIISNGRQTYGFTLGWEFDKIIADYKELFCYGVIEYQDAFGNLREQGFCWQYKMNYPTAHMSNSWMNTYYK